MFSLVISIIAIALAAILLLTSAYYGGESLTQGTAKAKVAQYKNEAHQISSVLTLFKAEKGGFITADGQPFSWQTLVDENYLKELPQTLFTEQGDKVFSWGIRDNVIYLPNVSDDVCIQANSGDGYGMNTGTAPTAATPFGPNNDLFSPAGWQASTDNNYIPVCDDGLSDDVPCCFDNTPAP